MLLKLQAIIIDKMHPEQMALVSKIGRVDAPLFDYTYKHRHEKAGKTRLLEAEDEMPV